ncbi:MAG: hypothetical protein QGG54_07720 [Gammaproteobacteria bacterium]|nr:hypothetical protein [Gammaproteobacteria bacterium]
MNKPCPKFLNLGFAVTLFLFSALPAHADYKADVGYTALESELGTGIPDGSGVPVSQSEASIQVGTDTAWILDPGNAEFSGKTVTDVSGAVPGIYSGHATGVGKKFFGNTTSTSPGITNIAAYLVDHWISSGFLRVTGGGGQASQPRSSSSRINNHSWIGNGATTAVNTDALTRLDWVIERDEMVQTVGFTGSASNPLLGSGYNVISVNTTHTPTDAGSAAGGGIYTSGRTKPEIVAPANTTSSATPRVASATALLIDAAHGNPAWSTDPVSTSTTNRNGDTIYNAERVEVIKAALMTGADRATSNSTSADITDYRVDVADQTVNGLDRRFGAGQLNIYNSYHAIAAGEQNSLEDQAGSAGLIGTTGFDYDPAFGGSQGSNATATYYFSPTSAPARLSASLVWNLAINGGSANNFNGSATLYDLDLQLFDVTDPGNWVLVGGSASANENTENLWLLLEGGKDYALQVTPGAGQAAFKWDYGLAWQVIPVPPPLALEITYGPEVGVINQFYWWGGLSASGGEPPYTFSLISGYLQWNLTLNQDTGVIMGIPQEGAWTAPLTVQVTDALLNSETIQFEITVKQANYVCGSCHGASSF